jgi:glycosyltransferase involved in cell wall biosynthesis
MKKVLIIMGRYLPGTKDGGPVRSIKNMTDRLGKEYDFYILTADRDHGDLNPYEKIEYSNWNQVGNAKVYYAKPHGFDKETILNLSHDKDLIYMCGCFNDYARTVLWLKKKGVLKCRVVIASMGLFSPGAFHIKYTKKRLYMGILNSLKMFSGIEWSATSAEEAADIKKRVRVDGTIYLAEDLPRLVSNVHRKPSEYKDELRVIFLSRISRKKNLDCAIRILNNVKDCDVVFDIYGFAEDEEYWSRCNEMLRELPKNIKWRYCGAADAEKVVECFSNYDIFLFPTLAENYGHVIFESLSGGCVPIISDKTPWTAEKLGDCGVVIALEREDLFSDAIEKYSRMDKTKLEELSQKCIRYASEYTTSEDSYRKIFDA